MDVIFDPVALNLDVARIEQTECVCKCINPAHIDSNPSAYFNMVTGLFYCHSCGFSGNVYNIIEITSGYISKIQSSNIVNDFFDAENDWQKYLQLPNAYNNLYLLSRRVTKQQIEEFQIKEASNKVIVPIFNIFNNPIGVIIRHLKNRKFKYQILGEKSFWPHNLFYDYNHEYPVIVTEGLFGVLNARNCGLQAVSTLGATNIPSFYGTCGYALCGAFDDDEAGWLASINLLSIHNNAVAVYRGVEADEIGKEKWDEILNYENNYLTNDMRDFELLFENKYKLKLNNRRLKNLFKAKKRKK